MQVSFTSLDHQNPQIFYPFFSNYFNPNSKQTFNFSEFLQAQNDLLISNSPSSSMVTLSSSHHLSCKQEDQGNFYEMASSLSDKPEDLPLNIKDEPFIQTKYEDESIHDFSLNNHSFPVKFEVKNEDDQPSSLLHHRSKKITKERSNETSSSYEPDQVRKIKSRKKKTRQTWTPEEEVEVLELMKKYGTKWSKIASCMKCRNGKQVRDHYLNSLAPDINRGGWTEEDDQAILFYYEKFGAQWCKIAECVPGRTETSVKGRFYTNLKQKRMMKGAKVEIVLEKNQDGDGFWR